MPARSPGSRIIAATAPPPETIWTKALAMEARLDALVNNIGAMTGYPGADGNAAYTLGMISKTNSSDQTIGTGSQQLTWDGGVNTIQLAASVKYRFHWVQRFKQGPATNANLTQINVSGSPTFSLTWFFVGAIGSSQGGMQLGNVNANMSTSPTTPAEYIYWLDGVVTAGASGSVLQLFAQATTTFTARGGLLDVWPTTS